MPDLAVRNLHKIFDTPAGPLSILKGVDLELSRGESAVVTGPSGSGKSTLLYILGLLDTPSSGDYELLKEKVGELPPDKQADVRNSRVGFVFQDHHLLPQCTVMENVLIPTIPAGDNPEDARRRAESLLTKVGLAERVDHRPGKLSGGERQRVAVCRALINEPVLLLADEPTGSLDPHTARAVGELLLELAHERNTMLLCVTHSHDLAGRFPKRLDLQDGKLAELPP